MYVTFPKKEWLECWKKSRDRFLPYITQLHNALRPKNIPELNAQFKSAIWDTRECLYPILLVRIWCFGGYCYEGKEEQV